MPWETLQGIRSESYPVSRAYLKILNAFEKLSVLPHDKGYGSMKVPKTMIFKWGESWKSSLSRSH